MMEGIVLAYATNVEEAVSGLRGELWDLSFKLIEYTEKNPEDAIAREISNQYQNIAFLLAALEELGTMGKAKLIEEYFSGKERKK